MHELPNAVPFALFRTLIVVLVVLRCKLEDSLPPCTNTALFKQRVLFPHRLAPLDFAVSFFYGGTQMSVLRRPACLGG